MERSRLERMPDVPFKKFVDYLLKHIEIDDDMSNFYMLFNPNTKLGKILNAPMGSLSRLDIEYIYYYLNYNERPTIKEEDAFFEYDEIVTTTVTNHITIPTYVDLDESYVSELIASGELEHGSEWDEHDRDHIDTSFDNNRYFFP